MAIPILIPLNVVGGGALNDAAAGNEGLTKLNIGNVRESWRLWFHLVLTIIFCGKCVCVYLRNMYFYL